MLEEEYETDRRRLPRHLRKQAAPEAPFEYRIRPATKRDLPEVREIYNHYVANTVVTFDERPSTHAYWRDRHARLMKRNLPFLVAESPAGHLLGFAYVWLWREKSAYRHTGEVSIYLGPASTGKGLGTALLGELIAASKAAGLKELLAVIADGGAEASVALHRKHGFTEAGRLGKVGYKFGRWVGTIVMQRSLRR